MNNIRKKAALKKFAPGFNENTDLAELKAKILADQNNGKPYTEAEADEVVAAINAGETGEDAPPPPPPPPGSEGTGPTAPETKEELNDQNHNRYYGVYRVEPLMETIEDEFSGQTRKKLKGSSRKNPFGDDNSFEKLGKAFRHTWITPERARMLNEHSLTSRERYYEETPPAETK